MSDSTAKIKSYYSKFDEWSRLDSDSGKVELFFVLRIIEKYFNVQDTVLDLGGGSGRVSSEMAKLGYHTVLVDLSKDLLEDGKKKIADLNLSEKVSGYHQVNATDLSIFDNDSFSSIYCAGPFYHLLEREDQEKAVTEIFRILKPNGQLIVNIMPLISGVRGLFYRMAHAPEHVAKGTVTNAFKNGHFHNSSDLGFQEGKFFNLQEIDPLFENAGFKSLEKRSIKGISTNIESFFLKTREENPDLFNEMVELIELTSTREDVLSLGDYISCVYQKN